MLYTYKHLQINTKKKFHKADFFSTILVKGFWRYVLKGSYNAFSPPGVNLQG